jgi:hypothetical protein
MARASVPAAGLDPLDTKLLKLLFEKVGAKKDSITLEDIKEYARTRSHTFSDAIDAWKALALTAAKERGFTEPAGDSWQAYSFGVAILLAIGGAGLGWAVGSVLTPSVPVASAAVLALLGVQMRRRSRAANDLLAQYKALRNYLREPFPGARGGVRRRRPRHRAASGRVARCR